MKTLKTYMLLAAAAILMAACTAEPVQQGSEQPEAAAGQLPLGFSAYLSRATGTKSTLTSAELQTAGFGVFGYYTDDRLYDGAGEPNFMYNTHVTYSAGKWTYSPLRYWPNEYGKDRVSFFAYAPWASVDNASGLVAGAESGILSLNRNGAKGDPYVRFACGWAPDSSVDLCWAVESGSGKPLLNCLRQDSDLSLSFKHALSSLNIQVKADLEDSPYAPDGETRIWVRSVRLDGVAPEGSFNLNSSSARWFGSSEGVPLTETAVTLHDGRADGAEGRSPALREKPVALNSRIIQDAPYGGPTPEGVTATPKNLFESASAGDPVYVIPTGKPLVVTICYDVETVNPKLAGTLSDGLTHGSSVENRITREVSFGGVSALAAGSQYTLTLLLGMHTVKFEAAVTDWEYGQIVLAWQSWNKKAADSEEDDTYFTGYKGNETFGLYAVDPSTGALVDNITNLAVEAGSDGSLNIAALRTGERQFNRKYRYFVYGPWQDGLTGVDPGAATADDFFAGTGLEAAAIPTDQDTEDKLRAQDLQWGMLEAEAENPVVPMPHRRALMVTRMGVASVAAGSKVYLYYAANTSAVKYANDAKEEEYNALDRFTDGREPFRTGTRGTRDYRCYSIVEPDTDISVTTDYTNGEGTKQWDDLSYNVPAGEYQLKTTSTPPFKYWGRVYNYNGSSNNNGTVQTFTLPINIEDYGCRMECWGAQGGGAGTTTGIYRGRGGQGGYVSGYLHRDNETARFSSGTAFYAACGGAGGCQSDYTYPNQRAWNGGGIGNRSGGSGGGGAAHIAINDNLGELKNYEDHQEDILLVAGAGAGSNDNNAGGYGGYTSGGNGVAGTYSPKIAGRGGSQTAGGSGSISGAFGQGGDRGNGYDGSGGGAGWYGGGSGGGNNASGGGGSSYYNATYITSFTYMNGSGNGRASVANFPDPDAVPGVTKTLQGNYTSGMGSGIAKGVVRFTIMPYDY